MVILVSACGFHLRGSGDTQSARANLGVLSPLTITGGESDLSLRNQLGRALKEAGVTISEQSGGNVLVIENAVRDRRVSSVGANGKVSEYELYYAVTFSLSHVDGKNVLPSQTVNVVRNYAFNEQELLSKSVEQGRLYDDMRFDVVRMIVRRLQAQTKR